MTDDFIEKHQAFVLNKLIPAIHEYAKCEGVQPWEAALASLLALGEGLQYLGITADDLVAEIKAGALSAHDAPEVMQ